MKKYPNSLTSVMFCLSLLLISLGATMANGSARQNERLVIGAIKQIYEAQANFIRANAPAGAFTTLETLANEGYIDSNLGRGQKYGYRFDLINEGNNYKLSVVPSVYGKNGRRSFYFDGTCKIRGADKNGGPATTADPDIDACIPIVAHHNEHFAVQGMLEVFSAEMNYRNRFGDFTADLSLLGQLGLLNSRLANGYYQGYYFAANVTMSGPGFLGIFRIQAIPANYGTSGVRSFYIDQKGILRGADRGGRVAGVSDPPVIR